MVKGPTSFPQFRYEHEVIGHLKTCSPVKTFSKKNFVIEINKIVQAQKIAGDTQDIRFLEYHKGN